MKPAHAPADTRDNIAGVCCLGLEVLSMMDDSPVRCTTVDSTQIEDSSKITILTPPIGAMKSSVTHLYHVYLAINRGLMSLNLKQSARGPSCRD